MKLSTLSFSAISFAAVLVLTAAAVQDKGKDPKAGAKPAGQEHTMPEVKAGPEHAMLAKDVGTWDATVTDHSTTPPTVSKGTEVRRMLGDMWQLSDFTGEMGGKPFLGHGVTGYDQAKKKYVGTWIDTMSSSISTSEGTYDAATKKLTSSMKMSMGGKEMTCSMVVEDKDDNTQIMTMTMPGPDGKMGTMTIEYKRRK